MRSQTAHFLASQGLRRALLFLWVFSLVAVIVGSLLPSAVLDRVDPAQAYLNDKQQHFLAYLGLALLPPLAFYGRRSSWFIAASMLLLGIGLEFAQRLTPDRTFDYEDMKADGLGVLAGMLLSWLFSVWFADRAVRKEQ